MLRFLSKKMVFILILAFTVSLIPAQIYADDADDIEDAQKLSDTLLVVGVALAVGALVFALVYGSVKKNKEKRQKEAQQKQIKEVEVTSDSLQVETSEP